MVFLKQNGIFETIGIFAKNGILKQTVFFEQHIF